MWAARASHLFAAASLLAVSAQLLRTWIDPLAVERGAWVKFGVGLMMLEFLFVHSGAFAAHAFAIQERKKRMQALLGLSALYGLFAGVMVLAVGEPRLALVYVGVMGGRAWAGWSDAHHRAGDVDISWVLSVVAYLACVFSSAFMPWPHLGLPPRLGEELMGSSGDGLWEEQPHRAIGAGTVYFAILAAFEAWRALLVRDNRGS
jgi:hypothetical protein